LIYLENEPIVNKNKNNKFISLARALFNSLKPKIVPTDILTNERLINVATYSNLPLGKVFDFSECESLK